MVLVELEKGRRHNHVCLLPFLNASEPQPGISAKTGAKGVAKTRDFGIIIRDFTVVSAPFAGIVHAAGCRLKQSRPLILSPTLLSRNANEERLHPD